MIIENLYLSDEAHCLTTLSTEMIGKAEFEPMRVSTPAGDSIIPMVRVTLRRLPGEYLADRNTGTLYCPNTGKCFSSGVRKVLGLSVAPVVEPARPRYDYGRQVITKEEKAPPKEKVGRGNGLGTAKLNEDTVRALREKREDGSFSIA